MPGGFDELLQLLGEAGGAVAAKQVVCGWGELVTPVWAVDGAVGFVRVFEQEADLDELVDGLAADGLAGVGLVAHAVVIAHPVHDLGDAAQGCLGGRPFTARADVGEGEQGEGGAVVLLLLGDADGDKKLKGFFYAFGSGGFHRHAKEGAPRSFVMARSMAAGSASARRALPSFSKAVASG